jgi:hypothetical protein
MEVYSYKELPVDLILLLEEFNQRLMLFEPIMPRNEVIIPEGGLQFLEQKEAELLLEAIEAEVDFMLNQFDTFFETLIMEMAPAFFEAGVDITPLNDSIETEIRRIATVLNTLDNISAASRLRITTAAANAQTSAFIRYRNDPNRQSAYRHFSWALKVTVYLGSETARLATNNHELARAGFTYEGNRFNLSNAQISNRRTLLLNDAATSSTRFADHFLLNGHIKDFWNNRAGRYRGVDIPMTTLLNYHLTPHQMFVTAVNRTGATDVRRAILTFQPPATQRNAMYLSNWWNNNRIY